MMNQISYRNLRPDLKTGDIVLYSGRQRISTVIKLATRSHWSHVGMVIYLPEADLVAVWESTRRGTHLVDIDSGQVRKGVQLVPLGDRLRTYKGSFAIRQLRDATLTSDNFKSLWALRRVLAESPYEDDRLELLKAAYDGPFGRNDEDLSSIFCSELVAEAYQSLGLLSEHKASNEYVPADFSSSRELALERGTLGPEILVEI